MSPTDETIRLIELSRSRMQQDLTYLRMLSGGLAQTQAVIERATLAYAVSNHLLGKNDQAAVEPPQPDQSERANGLSDGSGRRGSLKLRQRRVGDAPIFATALKENKHY